MVKRIISILLFIMSFNVQASILPTRIIKPNYEGKSHNFTAIYVSPFDNIYTIDQLNNAIYLLDFNGEVLNSGGGFGWQQGLFDRPLNLSSPDGLNIYVADYNNQRIAYYDRQLNFLGIFPDQENIHEKFYPLDVCVSRMGRLFILDDENKEILCFNQDQELINRFGGIDYGQQSIQKPIDMLLTDRNNIGILENDRILLYSQFGKPVNIIPLPDSLQYNSFCEDENKFVITTQKSKILIINLLNNKIGDRELINLSKVKNITSANLIDDKLILLNSNGTIYIFNLLQLPGSREGGRLEK